ncbi:MAG: SpoIID/LytB domain-containing protein [Paludibacteraceae bacterium]|nr:SpoIID/LytB domain-containing protein [Paludibacteraceae bacterium]
MNIRVGILTAPLIQYELTDNGFTIRNVRIGIGFHWDRCEDQSFHGEITIRNNNDGTQTAVNTLDVEDYLCSVISSEMNSNSPIELLKAHAVISRSWAIRAIEANHINATNIKKQLYESNGHIGFDVCADDHCQRYEGTKRMNNKAIEAVRQTQHQVLMYNNTICDTRYHKCCGGKTEDFATCWEDIHLPYLTSVDCTYCNTQNKQLLTSALNDYDQETNDFHDWTVTYSQQELNQIVKQKSGIDFGNISDLIPLKRGLSGRIYQLQIVGTQRTETVGKELKIRRLLSLTCLYSSWFDVKKQFNTKENQLYFILHGHGWGHGVGLCQIGAAAMAAQGADYKQILNFYYPNTTVQQYK